jgi:hypothetical protein
MQYVLHSYVEIPSVKTRNNGSDSNKLICHMKNENITFEEPISFK